MGVVTISSSATRTRLGLNSIFSTDTTPLKRMSVVSFKTDKPKNASLIVTQESLSLPRDNSKGNKKKLRQAKKKPERVQATTVDEVAPTTIELDYSEAAAKLESIYKRCHESSSFDTLVKDCEAKTGRDSRKRPVEAVKDITDSVVRSRKNKAKRLSLDKRISLRTKKELEKVSSSQKIRSREDEEVEKIHRLLREYANSSDIVSLDWKKMKIPPVLPSSEHVWLFKLMQPMKEILEVKKNLKNDLGREPTDGESAQALNVHLFELKKNIEVGQAARNKLIKHNLRLVLFVMNKYFQDFVQGPKFQDLCQAGVKGLITAIDRFEPNRRLRLSTYGLFWIRHAIIRSMTVSSFTKVPFGLESVRVEIQKAKLELLFELQRLPTEVEIIERVRISPERYNEVMNASKSAVSLNARHSITQEEFINGITDVDGVEGDKRRQPALLRLALDDVLDSLKPKESLVTVTNLYGPMEKAIELWEKLLEI
ncbi:hypothetical protein Leryth_025705 [Lithospermum erythrorhizon]|nr:hypothetical protein Leryth_025705 [Lithospermum erythrorhizon]